MRKFKKIGRRKGLNDKLKYKGKFVTIETLIEHYPLVLWQAVYAKGISLSLTKPAIYKLKAEIAKCYPEKIAELEAKKRLHMRVRKYNKKLEAKKFSH